MAETIVNNRLCKPIDALSIDKNDLQKFFLILQERANSACDIECNHIETIVLAESLEKSIEDLRSCSTLKLTINGQDGEELFGSINEVFESLSFPEQIKSIYVNSELLYKSNFNYIPRNRFDIFIDFSKPKVFDFSFAPSEKTPNRSTFCVEGFDNTWVNGVYSEIDKFFGKRSSTFPGIHKNSIYDFVVWIIGIPLGFWVCFKLASSINELFSSSFLQSAVFVYVFFLSLFILRILFHYSRWLYPKIQFKSTKDSSTIHRSFFYIITIGIIGTFLYDLLRQLF